MSYQGTAIVGQATAQLAQMEAFVRRVNPSAPDVARIYLKRGPELGLRGDLAYAQAIHETNYFRYGGVVKPFQNNYCGLGSTGPENPGTSFATPEEGVIAHLQHLYAYASKAPLPQGMKQVDPRFDRVERGVAAHVGDLNGRWAVPGTNYGQLVDRILGEILMEPAPGEPYKITRAYLDATGQNRPGACAGSGCWEGVEGIVVHRTASPTMDARAIQQYFNEAPDGRSASSQFVVDNNVILQLMPVGEVAYHTVGRNRSYLGIETCENTWGTDKWPETYRKLVWLTAYLVRAFRLTISDVTGHFWWDSVNRPYDPTHLGWSLQEGRATGLFDWNQFIADLQVQLTTPQAPAAPPIPVSVRVAKPTYVDCTDGLLLNSVTYVPIRSYTACLLPEATVHWDPQGPGVVVAVPPSAAKDPPQEGAVKRWWKRLWQREL